MGVKIIQITDLHIGAENEKPFDVDVRGNFKSLLATLRNESFEHLVVSGDLCYRDPDETIYRWVKQQLDALQVPYSIMPGNHDDNRMINNIFRQKDLEKLYYTKEIHGRTIYFMDSGPGTVDREQLQWLEQQLNPTRSFDILFIHHPPAICQVPHMDKKHFLRNHMDIQNLIHNYPGQFHIFCGHYHLEKTVSIKNMHIHITPSNFFQIDDRYAEFEIASRKPGYRRIDFKADSIFTAVKYVN